MLAKDIMNSNVITVDEELNIDECVKILLDNKISGIPVVNKQNNVIGIITESDLIYTDMNLHLPSFISIMKGIAFSESAKKVEKQVKKLASLRVKDVMSRNVITVMENTRIDDIIEIIVDNDVNRIPVVDKDDKLIGIITRSDVLRFIGGRNKE